MTEQRKYWSPEEKVSALRKHFLEQVPISTICDEINMQPSMFYRWQKELFEKGVIVFKNEQNGKDDLHYQKKIEALENKLKTKDSVLAELMEEYVALKKNLGEK